MLIHQSRDAEGDRIAAGLYNSYFVG